MEGDKLIWQPQSQNDNWNLQPHKEDERINAWLGFAGSHPPGVRNRGVLIDEMAECGFC